MVRIIQKCECRTCDGGHKVKPGTFGGSHCMCRCHDLEGEKKEIFIKMKEDLFK